MNTRGKRNIFDAALYRDMLRQLRMVGIVCLVLMTVAGAILPLGRLSELENMSVGDLYTLELLTSNPGIVLFPLIWAPLMMLTAFGFLNQRKSSDFYHALANTRLSLYLSMLAAAVTWLVLDMAVSATVSRLLCLLLRPYYVLNMAGLWVGLFNMLAAVLLVCGAFAVSMSVTGKTLNNVVVALLLLFLPRFFVLLFTSLLSDALPLLPSGSGFVLFNNHFNVLTNMIFGLFVGNVRDSFEYVWGGVYTLVLGVVYLAVGAVLFARRRSEVAGQSSANRFLQALFRLSCGMVIAVIPSAIIAECLLRHESVGGSDIFWLAVLYVAAVLVYFLYELITTRKWRNVAKSVPTLGILVLLCLLFIGGEKVCYDATLRYQPVASEIRSVQMVSDVTDPYGNGKDYFRVKEQEVSLNATGSQVGRIVSEALDRAVTMVKNDSWWQRDYTYIDVSIRTDSGEKKRTLPLEQEEYAALLAEMKKTEAYRRIYMELPAYADTQGVVFGNIESADANRRLYEILREEVKTADFADWYTCVGAGESKGFVSVGSPSDAETALANIAPNVSVRVPLGTAMTRMSFQLPTFLPKTFSAYLSAVNQNPAQVIQVLKAPMTMAEDGGLQVALANTTDSDGSSADIMTMFWMSEFDAVRNEADLQWLAELAELAERYQGTPVDVSKPLLYVRYCGWDAQSRRYRYDTVAVNIPEGSAPPYTGEYMEDYVEYYD